MDSYFSFWALALFNLYFFRYGSGMLEDNLVARVYTSYETEGHFLAFYTVLNCYVYLLAYVYSPTSTQVYKHISISSVVEFQRRWVLKSKIFGQSIIFCFNKKIAYKKKIKLKYNECQFVKN